MPVDNKQRFFSSGRLGREGFTLLELLVAFFILAMTLTVLWSGYREIFSLTRRGEEAVQTYQMARGALDLLRADLLALTPFRGAFVFTAGHEFRDGRDFSRLSFAARNRMNFWGEEAPSGLVRIEYRVVTDRQGRHHLFRETLPLPAAPGATPTGFVIGENIESFSVSFSDRENRRREEWDTVTAPGGKSVPPPRLIEIELTLQEGETGATRRFSTGVFLPLGG